MVTSENNMNLEPKETDTGKGCSYLVCIIRIAALFFGVIFLWGSPTVVINTSGRDMRGVRGWPWHAKNADQFAEVLRTQILK